MGFLITPPSTQNSNQLKLGETISDTVPLIANTATDLIETDGTALNGRKIYSITSASGTSVVKIALGRTATDTDYDYPLHPGVTIGDFDFSADNISAISTTVATVNISYAKYE